MAIWAMPRWFHGALDGDKSHDRGCRDEGPRALGGNCCRITTGPKKSAEASDFALFNGPEASHPALAEGTPSFRGRMNQLALGVKR